MRTAITLHKLHGKDTFDIVSGPEVPMEKQKEAIKDLARDGRTHAKIEIAELWKSDAGRVKRYVFDKPAKKKKAEDSDEDKAAAAKAADEKAKQPASKTAK